MYVHVQYMCCALGDCLTSRPKGRLRPRELWFTTDLLMYNVIGREGKREGGRQGGGGGWGGREGGGLSVRTGGRESRR